MKFKSLFFILAATSVISFTAKADNSGFEACQARGSELMNELGRPSERLAGDNLGVCVANFVKTNAGENHVKANDWCGAACWVKKKAAERFAGPARYLQELKDETTAEMIKKIEAGAGKSLKEIVDASYRHYAVLNKAQTDKTGGYTVFNGILFDTIQFYMNAEVVEMGLKEVEGLNGSLQLIESEIFDCLKVIKSKGGIRTCVAKFQTNAVFKFGQITLKYNLEKHFKEEVDAVGFKILEAAAADEYNKCSVKHYFDPSIKAKSDTDKGKACVFSAILEAFSTATKTIINSKSNLATKEVEVAVKDLISQCGDQKFLEMRESDKYLALQELTQETYVDYLLKCKDSVKEGAVARIGAQTIAAHPAVVGVLGSERAAIFAKEIISEGLPECLEKMEQSDNPEKCENYLFAKTAVKIFPIVLDEKFQEFRSEFKFLTDDLIEKSVDSALTALSTCNAENQKDFEAFLNLNELEADAATSGCVKAAILSSLQEIIEVYLESEISNNKILVQYGIGFGSRKKTELKNAFNQCAEENILTNKGLTSVVESSEKFLDVCILRIMKKIVLETMDIIVEKELRKIGVPFSDVSKLINDYKLKENNVFQKIENSQTVKELEAMLETADKEIIEGVSNPIIEFLIKKKSPVKFSDDVLKKLVQRGKSSLSACIKVRDTETCSGRVEDEVMALGIELYMPEVLKEKLLSYRKEYPFLSRTLIGRATEDAKKELSSCFSQYKNSAKKISAEQQAANCAKRTIVTAMDRIVDAYISTEISKNRTLKKYGIRFGSREKESLKKTFKKCASNNISTKNGLDSVLKSSETFLDKCAGEAMKEVALGNMGTILKKELKGIGLSSSDADKIIKSYRAKKGNAFSVVKYTKPERLERTLNTLDKKIVIDLADDVLRILIREKSPIKMSSYQMNKLVAKGKSSLQSCMKKKEISQCSGPAEKELMILAIQLYFPSAVASEFKSSVSKWISSSQFKTLKIEELVSSAIYKSEGRKVARVVVTAFNKGSSVKSIENLSAVRTFISDTLLSSERRVQAIANFIIQKELDKFVKNPKGLKAQLGLTFLYNGGKHPALKWVNIRSNRSGREVMRLFKRYLRKIVVSSYELRSSDYKILEDLVYKAVREYSGSSKPAGESSKPNVKGKWPKYRYKTISKGEYKRIKNRRVKGLRTTYTEKKQYYTYLYELNCIQSPNHKESKKSCPMLHDKMKKYKYRKK